MTQADSVHSTPPTNTLVADNVVRFEPRRPRQGAMVLPQTVPIDYSTAFFHLPFVTLPAVVPDNWGDFWERTSMWNDEPAGDGDGQRGSRYAREAVEILQRENACVRQLEIVVEHMIARAFRRRGPGGRLCRGLSHSETTFLQELCRMAVYPKVQK